jgi:NAD(P)-dependent dehydrogenase (short-subunit alcohol dehydrogenase family)
MDTESIRRAVDETERRFGSMDVLINNAGEGLGGAVEGVTREELTILFNLNLFGLIAVIQAVLPSMCQTALDRDPRSACNRDPPLCVF